MATRYECSDSGDVLSETPSRPSRTFRRRFLQSDAGVRVRDLPITLDKVMGAMQV